MNTCKPPRHRREKQAHKRIEPITAQPTDEGRVPTLEDYDRAACDEAFRRLEDRFGDVSGRKRELRF